MTRRDRPPTECQPWIEWAWVSMGQRGVAGTTLRSTRPPQFFQVPYTALTMLLTSSPKERDSATAYRECSPGRWWGELPPEPGGWLGHLCAMSPGMTMEMVGTLMGATVHGLIVSGAHRSNHCELPGPAAVSPDAVSTHSGCHTL